MLSNLLSTKTPVDKASLLQYEVAINKEDFEKSVLCKDILPCSQGDNNCNFVFYNRDEAEVFYNKLSQNKLRVYKLYI